MCKQVHNFFLDDFLARMRFEEISIYLKGLSAVLLFLLVSCQNRKTFDRSLWVKVGHTLIILKLIVAKEWDELTIKRYIVCGSSRSVISILIVL